MRRPTATPAAPVGPGRHEGELVGLVLMLPLGLMTLMLGLMSVIGLFLPLVALTH